MSGKSLLEKATGLGFVELEKLALQAPESYERFPRRKANGSVRWLCAPNGELKRVQRAILDELLYRLNPHPAAHGFVPGRSVVTHAALHTHCRWVVGIDIKNFFDETTESAARSVFAQMPELSPAEIDILIGLCCLNGGLPQGAPTSPCIANLYFKPADMTLQKYAENHGLSYSRYADDLAFSGAEIPADLIEFVTDVCKRLGYRLAHRKTRRLGSGLRQLVTGLVVNKGLSVPRPLRRRLRAILHDAEKRGINAALERAELKQSALIGLIGWVSMTDEDLGRDMMRDLHALVERA